VRPVSFIADVPRLRLPLPRPWHSCTGLREASYNAPTIRFGRRCVRHHAFKSDELFALTVLNTILAGRRFFDSAATVTAPGVTGPGTVTSALEECMDIFPTFIEMAGQPLPKQPLDGYSLVPVLQRSKPPDRAFDQRRRLVPNPDEDMY